MEKLREFNLKRLSTMLILILTYIVAYLMRKGASYVSPYLLDLFNATKMDWANLVALTSAAYGLGKFVLPNIADRTRTQSKMLGWYSIWSGVLVFFMGKSNTWFLFCLAFVGMCFFQGQALPNSVSIICKWYRKTDRSLAYTIWSASHKIGFTLSGILAGWFVAKNWLAGNFYVPAALAVLIGVAILLLVKNEPKDEWREYVHETPTKITNVKLDFKKNVYLNKNILKVCVVAFFAYLSYTVMADMGTLIFVGKGFERLTAVKIMVTFSSLAFLGGFLCSLAAKKLFKDKIIQTVRYCFILMAGMFIIMSCISHAMPLVLILLIMAIAGVLCDVVQIMPSVISTLCCSTDYSGSATGYVGIWQQIGVILCSYISGALLTYISPNASLYMSAAGCLIGAVILKNIERTNNVYK